MTTSRHPEIPALRMPVHCRDADAVARRAATGRTGGSGGLPHRVAGTGAVPPLPANREIPRCR